jgi:hypothetical protein
MAGAWWHKFLNCTKFGGRSGKLFNAHEIDIMDSLLCKKPDKPFNQNDLISFSGAEPSELSQEIP